MISDPNHYVILGQVVGVFGIKGWVKIRSDTQPYENILEYSPWYVHEAGGWNRRPVLDSRRQHKGLIVQLQDVSDRDTAATLVGCEIGVPREDLPRPGEGEYYWTDLIGLRVRNREGEDLGTVQGLLETGANDVLVVKDADLEHLIPYVKGYYVLQVDLENGFIEVDWQREYTTGE